ncbi:HpcH/HpaI aldolase family protein [Leucobacter aridicollis]|uniref:HpcH/HpaI aldolase family protein n=1 Tax=Leucobacter aridicollis TaxID=283878 RepID=UPI002167398C|nr:HpcH/HpaI aldolase/citrate lyase family protein [Leucobacter aridicollis]MCS3426985.1 4-hydroxy-2-oxoheptanedioate aldolase [Leucobacter aridicollis]
MPIHLELPPTLRDRLAESDRALIGLWATAGSAVNAEIVAGSGCDWVLLDAEHSPNGLESLLAQLHAMAPYPATVVVRPPYGDTVTIKQFLDLGAQNLLIPMVDSAEHAEEVVRATRYAPEGTRGVGSALARSARWNRVENYLARANDLVSVTVQIESVAAVSDVQRIVAVDGVDAVFIGPADLAASMGLLGQQSHPAVVDAVLHVISAARAAGKPVGVNAFMPEQAERYIEAGANFVAVGADVAILARATEALVDQFIPSGSEGATAGDTAAPRASY